MAGWKNYVINMVAAAIKKAENASLRGKFCSITKKMHKSIYSTDTFVNLQIYITPEFLPKTPLFSHQPPAKCFESTPTVAACTKLHL
jgi:hypothetical protein